MSLSAGEARSLVEQGVRQLQTGQLQAASDSFGQLVRECPNLVDAHLGLAQAHKRLGRHAQASAALDAALTLQPRHIGALVLKGDWLEAAGASTAASFYQAALNCASQLEAIPRDLQSVVARAQAMCTRYAQQFEQGLRSDLASLGPAFGPPSPRFARSLNLLTGRARHYLSAPRLFLFPELPTIQFFDRALFAWIEQLEAATASIRAEMTQLMAEQANFRPYVESDASRPALNQGGLIDNRDWSACFLWKNGARVAAHADRCPATEAVLAQLPLVQIPGRSPSVLFSLMRPGAHIPAHHGFVNTRLIVHLPLVVPSGCRFRVGDETREWEEGKAWLFDDTIEHEAWNTSRHDRVVLILEVWRPELTAGERAYVSGLFQSIERQRGGVGDWAI